MEDMGVVWLTKLFNKIMNIRKMLDGRGLIL